MMTGEGRLVVVVPRRFDQRNLPAILQAKRQWIERARSRVAARRPVQEPGSTLPDRIVLPAIGEEWEVEYRPSPVGPAGQRRRPAVARERPGRRLVVTGPAADEHSCRRALLAWLHRRARNALVPRLEQMADHNGMRVERITVRHQRTRWASCSRRGTISLNLRLLFLEPALVDHILLHELCHTREPNHSQRFWTLLRQYDPDCGLHRRKAREAWHALPGWIDAGGAPQV
jgi:predicted metal-dependent hydrolase